MAKRSLRHGKVLQENRIYGGDMGIIAADAAG
jgi:hypothetical protein